MKVGSDCRFLYRHRSPAAHQNSSVCLQAFGPSLVQYRNRVEQHVTTHTSLCRQLR
ncbi:hypothetical protein Plhal710r2_c007g0032241 [Plasmopara halstedii]